MSISLRKLKPRSLLASNRSKACVFSPTHGEQAHADFCRVMVEDFRFGIFIRACRDFYSHHNPATMPMNDLPDSSAPRAEEQPRIPVKLEEFCAALAMALICCITFANVLVRYFTDVSFAFTEEFSIFLMVVLTFFGAAAAFVRDQHIRMTFLTDRLPPAIARKVEYVSTALCIVMFAVMAWYGTFLFWDDWQFDTTSPGVGIPQWIYTIWLPLLSALITLRLIGRLIRLLRAPTDRGAA